MPILIVSRSLSIFLLVLALTACQSTGNPASSPDSQSSANPVDVDIAYDKFLLDNGLTVLVHEDRKAPIVAVSVWYHVGSKDEPVGKTGFAHLFEHLMFNGSENYDGEYFEPFEKVGATDMNGTTWFDRTNYFQNVPSTALEMALWMESDRMGHLLGAIDQAKLDEQRGVVQNEKRQGDDRPYGKVEYRSLAGLFPMGHPYRHSTIGSMEDLNAASLEDVKQWFEDYYGAANAVLVIAGDVDPQRARTLAEKYFGHISAGPPVPQLKAWVPEKSENRIDVMMDRVPQGRVYRQWTVPGRTTRDGALLELAAKVLGSGKNSRLYKTLVYDKQLATSAYAYVQRHELASIFEVSVMLKPGGDEAAALAEIDSLVAEFLREGPSQAELERVRNVINADTVRGLEKIGGFGGKATTLAQGELYAGDPGFFKTRLNWLNNSNSQEIVATAREWLGKGYFQLSVRPFGELASGSPSAVDRSLGVPNVDKMPDLSFPAIQRGTLDNGIPVILATHGNLPLVNIALQFDAGFAADTGGKLGVSGFTMDMLNEGTSNMDALEIAAQAESLGANLYTDTDLDTATAGISALKNNLDPSLALLADVVLHPTFPQEEIDRRKKQWEAGIAQEQNNPLSLALRTLPPLIYGSDHSYGIPFTGSGTVESLASIERGDLLAFRQAWLRPDNVTLFVTGNTTLAEMLPLLNRHFKNWVLPASAPGVKNLARIDNPDRSVVYLIDKPDAAQSLILAGHVIPPTGADDTLLTETANDILGGSFTARVNMNLREDKGWSYGARTITWNARGQRPWIVYAPVQTDKTRESVLELKREFDDYLNRRPATADELQKVISRNNNSLPGRYETAGSVLNTLMANKNYGRGDDYVDGLKAAYESLSLDQVREQAGRVFSPDALTWVIVGDRQKIEDDLRTLDFDDVKIMSIDGNVVE